MSSLLVEQKDDLDSAIAQAEGEAAQPEQQDAEATLNDLEPPVPSDVSEEEDPLVAADAPSQDAQVARLSSKEGTDRAGDPGSRAGASALRQSIRKTDGESEDPRTTQQRGSLRDSAPQKNLIGRASPQPYSSKEDRDNGLDGVTGSELKRRKMLAQQQYLKNAQVLHNPGGSIRGQSGWNPGSLQWGPPGNFRLNSQSLGGAAVSKPSSRQVSKNNSKGFCGFEKEEYSDGYDSDLMGDDNDRTALEGLTQLDREMVLFKRSEVRGSKRRIKEAQRATLLQNARRQVLGGTAQGRGNYGVLRVPRNAAPQGNESMGGLQPPQLGPLGADSSGSTTSEDEDEHAPNQAPTLALPCPGNLCNKRSKPCPSTQTGSGPGPDGHCGPSTPGSASAQKSPAVSLEKGRKPAGSPHKSLAKRLSFKKGDKGRAAEKNAWEVPAAATKAAVEAVPTTVATATAALAAAAVAAVAAGGAAMHAPAVFRAVELAAKATANAPAVAVAVALAAPAAAGTDTAMEDTVPAQSKTDEEGGPHQGGGSAQEAGALGEAVQGLPDQAAGSDLDVVMDSSNNPDSIGGGKEDMDCEMDFTAGGALLTSAVPPTGSGLASRVPGQGSTSESVGTGSVSLFHSGVMAGTLAGNSTGVSQSNVLVQAMTAAAGIASLATAGSEIPLAANISPSCDSDLPSTVPPTMLFSSNAFAPGSNWAASNPFSPSSFPVPTTMASAFWASALATTLSQPAGGISYQGAELSPWQIEDLPDDDPRKMRQEREQRESREREDAAYEQEARIDRERKKQSKAARQKKHNHGRGESPPPPPPESQPPPGFNAAL